MAALVGCSEAPPLLPTPADEISEASFDHIMIERDFVDLGSYLRAPALEPRHGATRVGVYVTLFDSNLPIPQIEARGESGDWEPLEVTFSEGDQFVAILNLPELSRVAHLRFPRDDLANVAWLTWSALIPESHPVVTLDPDGIGAARAPLRAEIAAMGVVAREDWGARPTGCSTGDPSKTRMAIHHTVSPPDGDPASRVRGIQSYHMDSRGWCDVGYHFLVTQDGQIFEGRPIQYLGAHVGGFNTGNIGIAYVGCFHGAGCESFMPNTPSELSITTGANIVAGLSGLYGITVTPDSVKGHRDHGTPTACPGDFLHARLDDIRAGAMTSDVLAAQFVAQSFPLASMPFDVQAGTEVLGTLEMRNVGTATWRPGEVFLATTQPRDVASAIAGTDWVGSNRAASIDMVVLPGETGTFEFSVRAPDVNGDYAQFFGLVQEGVAWFSDPGQGGPPDDQIQIQLTSTGTPPMLGVDSGTTSTDAGATPDAGSSVDAGPTGPPPGIVSGCGCRVAGQSTTPWALSLLLLAVIRARNRRRCTGSPRAH